MRTFHLNGRVVEVHYDVRQYSITMVFKGTTKEVRECDVPNDIVQECYDRLGELRHDWLLSIDPDYKEPQRGSYDG
jgi:hypothetical protein